MGECDVSIEIRGKLDARLREVRDALASYLEAHPSARVTIYRQNNVSIRIRIVDRNFEGKSRADREDLVWAILEQLPEELTSEISLLLLLTPSEAKRSFVNHEFDNPIPSKL
jgi:stress-induced morphogen